MTISIKMNILDKILDRHKLSELRALSDGNDQLVHILLEKFSETTNINLVKALDFSNSGDYESAGSIIHGMKGAAGNIGLSELHLTCIESEKHLRNNDFEEFKRKVAQLGVIWNKISNDINATEIT